MPVGLFRSSGEIPHNLCRLGRRAYQSFQQVVSRGWELEGRSMERRPARTKGPGGPLRAGHNGVRSQESISYRFCTSSDKSSRAACSNGWRGPPKNGLCVTLNMFVANWQISVSGNKSSESGDEPKGIRRMRRGAITVQAWRSPNDSKVTPGTGVTRNTSGHLRGNARKG